jgi:pyruvate dehydrogenase E2 component (dihydrolipoamide acetyltransferase)
MAAGLDLRTIKGSGRGGRIRESDVIEAAERAPSGPIAQTFIAVPAVSGPSGTEIPITSLRRTIADRMHRSKSVTAPVTLTARVDATVMAKLRADWKAAEHHEMLPSYSDMIMKLVSGALLKHPALNARWEETRIVQPDSVNIGLAVDTPEGLLVPVVRDVQTLTLGHLAKKTADLVARARQRRLSAEELRGGTFTISSLGGMGVDLFTPIINHPECAVLGIGRIVREPVAVNEAVVLRDRMWLSLTFDHRVVDGAPAARFLETLVRAVEDPLAWLVA